MIHYDFTSISNYLFDKGYVKNDTVSVYLNTSNVGGTFKASYCHESCENGEKIVDYKEETIDYYGMKVDLTTFFTKEQPDGAAILKEKENEL